jgi:hypothetical protein
MPHVIEDPSGPNVVAGDRARTLGLSGSGSPYYAIWVLRRQRCRGFQNSLYCCFRLIDH